MTESTSIPRSLSEQPGQLSTVFPRAFFPFFVFTISTYCDKGDGCYFNIAKTRNSIPGRNSCRRYGRRASCQWRGPSRSCCWSSHSYPNLFQHLNSLLPYTLTSHLNAYRVRTRFPVKMVSNLYKRKPQVLHTRPWRSAVRLVLTSKVHTAVVKVDSSSSINAASGICAARPNLKMAKNIEASKALRLKRFMILLYISA